MSDDIIGKMLSQLSPAQETVGLLRDIKALLTTIADNTKPQINKGKR